MSEESPQNHKNRCRVEGKWILLGITCVCFLAHVYFTTAFVVVNGTVSEYFEKHPKDVEVLPALECLTAAVTGLALIFLRQYVEFRNLSTAAGAFLFSAGAAVTIGFMEGGTFWLIILGVATLGISFGMLILLPPWMAEKWFPSYSPGLLFALPYSFMYLGGMIAEAAFKQSFRHYEAYNETSVVESAYVEISFVRAFGMMVLIVFGSAVLLCLCVEDQSQSIQRNNQEANLETAEETCRCTCITQLTGVLRRKEFLLITTSNMFLAPVQIYTLYRMPGLLHHRFASVGANVFVYLHVLTMAAAMIGCLAAGILILWKKEFKQLPLIGSLITVLGSLPLCIGYVCNSLVMVGLFQEIMTFGAAFCVIAYLEHILNTSRSANKISTFTLHFGLYNLSLFLFDGAEILTAFNNQHETFIAVMFVSSFLAAILTFMAVKFCKGSDPQQVMDDDLQQSERSRLLST